MNALIYILIMVSPVVAALVMFSVALSLAFLLGRPRFFLDKEE
jgi:hypothetical protein